MKKLFLAFALVACFAVSALSQGAPPWTIQEVDGSPRVNSPTLIKVTNGTLSCTGKTCTITVSGGGGGSPGGSSTQVQYNAAGSFGGISGFTSDGTNVTAGSGNLRATRPRFITSIDDTNGNEVFVITATGSAVNEVTIANAATGNNPTFTASGSDANVGINFVPKGSGTIQVSGAAIVTVSATQTLTNKTLTTPVIAQISNTGTLTLPTSTDTLVGRATADTLTNKTLSTSNTVSASLTWTAGVKQTFAPNATTAGLNVGSVAGDPSTPSNGDLWYDSTANELTARINGANVALGSGGGGGITIGTTTITSGTNTRVLYNNAGVVGEYTITGTGNVVMSASPTLTGTVAMAAATASGTIVQTSASSAAFESGPNGSTNPVFRLVNSTASAVTGIQITGNAAGAGADIQVISSAAIDNLNIRTKGSGQISFFNNAIETFRLWTQSTSLFGTHIRYQNGVGGTVKAFWDLSNVNFRLASDGYYGFSSSTDATGAADWRIVRAAAGVGRLGGSSTTDAGNLLVGTSSGAIGTGGAGVLAFSGSTAPSTSPTDVVQVYSGDAAAADHNLYARNEAGQINRLTGLAVRNSAQFDVTSSTTLATVTGLTENVEAGRTYAFRAYVQTSAGAGGIKLAVGGTATATAISYEGELTSASDDNVVLIDRATALGTPVCDSSTTTSGTCKIEGVIQVNAAGTLVIQFAQSASNGTASSVLANQYLQLIPIS